MKRVEQLILWRGLSFALIGIGIALSGYLLLRTFQLLVDHSPDAIDVCEMLFGADCDLTLQSPSSWMLDIPLAGWGLIYYGALASLLLLGWAVDRDFERPASIAALLLSIGGAVFSVFLALAIISGRVALCPICLVVHALNLALVAAIWRAGELTVQESIAGIRSAGRYVLGGRTDSPVRSRWRVVAFLCVLLFSGLLYEWVLVQTERRQAVANATDPVRALSEYAKAAVREIPIDPEDPRLGPIEAEVQIVVFSSFGCPGCAAIAPVLHELTFLYHDRVAVLFKHLPAVSPCDDLPYGGANSPTCTAAWAAEAAHRQGRFWRFHDALFEAGTPLNEEGLQQAARACGLDLERFQEDRRDSVTRSRVRRDQQTARALGVTTTPAVFLNGRRVANISRKRLELLVVHELGKSRN